MPNEDAMISMSMIPTRAKVFIFSSRFKERYVNINITEADEKQTLRLRQVWSLVGVDFEGSNLPWTQQYQN